MSERMDSEFEFFSEKGSAQFSEKAAQLHSLVSDCYRDGALFCVRVPDTSKTQDRLLELLANRCQAEEV